MKKNFEGFKTFVRDIPENCIVYVAITDDVLDEKDWGIKELTIRNGVVVGCTIIYSGVYDLSKAGAPGIGWTTKGIEEWSKHDFTGCHPENFYEVKVCKVY